MADQKISQLSDAGAPQATDQFAIARAGSSLSILWSALSAAAGGAVSSVFGRTGAVTAQTGDYTAAQVGALAATASAGGDLTGNYPNPTIGSSKVTTAQLASSVTVDAIATAHATAADMAMNSHKITGLTNGSGAQDAAAFGQIPTALPPNGTAGGDLSGSYPNPSVAPAANVAMGSHKLTGLAAGTAAGDSVRFEQLPATAGLTQLVYRYTVTGSDKASIDTGSDTPDAGSNVWTNGDLLEIFVAARTDDAVNAALIYTMTLNNDTSSIYDIMRLQGSNATASATNILAQPGWNDLVAHGTSGQSGVAGVTQMVIPAFSGTSFNKQATCVTGITDSTAANNFLRNLALGYRSTSAITRVAITAAGTTKFKVGTQLLIYKRLAS